MNYIRTTLHFKFINDLNSVFNKVRTIHFADNTHISHASKKLSTIDSEMNYELKNLAEWLRSNKVYRKSETVINLEILSLSFSPHNKKLVRSSNKVKNYKLGPMQDVTYLGVALDEFLSWNANINNMCEKLAETNCICNTILIITDLRFSLFFFVLLVYVTRICSLAWQLTSTTNLKRFLILQNKRLCMIIFSFHTDHSVSLFKGLKLLKGTLMQI